jgi:hypothetical protein
MSTSGDKPKKSERNWIKEVPARATPQAPEDLIAYRVAVGALGLALVAFLIGAAVIAAGGKPVPTQYWATGSAIAGALTGILAPSPTAASVKHSAAEHKATEFLIAIEDVIRDLWANRALLILLLVFGFSAGYAISSGSSELEAVAAAAGGALVGLLAPPPGGQSSGTQSSGNQNTG